MQFQIVSSTVIPGSPVDNRNWLQRFRDWLADREPVPTFDVKNAAFYTKDHIPHVGMIVLLSNGTHWVVTHRRSFGYYADCTTRLQKDDVESSHGYSGSALEVAQMFREEEFLLQSTPYV
jgi:hypothetical protein